MTPGLTAFPTAPGKDAELLKKGLSHLHEALADYMLINPGCTLREMSQVFGYTGAWICTVTRSDMFQAYMAERRADVSALVHQSLPKKLEAAAHLATEKLIETLEKTSDGEMIVDIFDKVMHRYGYAPGARPGTGAVGMQAGGTVVQQNNFYLNKEELDSARTNFIEAHVVRERPVSPLLQMAKPEDSSEP